MIAEDTIERRGGARGDDIGDKAGRVPLVPPRDHGDLPDCGVPGQDGLDLAKLDPVAVDLHLVVGAAQVLQRSSGQSPGEIAGAVHPSLRVRRIHLERGSPGLVRARYPIATAGHFRG